MLAVASTSTSTSPPKSSKRRKPRSKKSSAKSSRVATPQPQNVNPGFVTGEDFIPFGVSEDEGEKRVGTLEDEDEKTGDKQEFRDKDTKPESERTRERNKRRGDRSRSRSKERDRGHSPPAREWDRGKQIPREQERRGGKRKSGDTEDFDDHYENKKQRVDAATRKCPWAGNFEWSKCAHVADMLHQEVKSFVEWVSPTAVEDEIRGLVVAQISAAVKSAFPDAQVLPFGSYETKLYLPLGDIDLVIVSESMAYSNKVTVLNALANCMRRAGITSTKVSIISKARVPIIKFVTTHGRFNVDISLNQQSGVVSGQIIRGFLAHMHGSGKGLALRALVMITKAFLAQRSMNEVFSGGLGSYSIVCLAISFLQMHPKIRHGEIDPEKNLGVLVMEFFEYYGLYFNYSEVGISVRDGGTYFNKAHRGWGDPTRGALLSIEDPADPSNDISKGSFQFPRVRSTLAGAYSLLVTAAYQRATQLEAVQSGSYTSLRHQAATAEEMSILSCIMGITQETLNHRKLVQELYENGALNRIVGVSPKAQNTTTTTTASTSSSKNKPANVKQNIRKVTGLTLDSDEEARESSKGEDKEEEEEGRYGIERRQPPHKRQKTGKPQDDSVVTYVSDDDEEGEDGPVLLNIKGNRDIGEEGDGQDEEEEGDYASASSSDDEEGDSRRGNRDKKRSYWLSKGLGVDLGNESS